MPFTVRIEPPKFEGFSSPSVAQYGLGRHNVTSSHGSLVIDRHGFVLSREIAACCPINSLSGEDHFDLLTAFAFDVWEWEDYWGKRFGDVSDFDILDLGYWYVGKNGQVEYEAPANHWREELKIRRKGNLD